MTDRLIRLMRIITLVQAMPGILARELAERCGTSERTIYRDMDALSAMHIPVTHQGYGKGYKFIGDFSLYPLDWTDEEMSAFAALPAIMSQIKPLLPAGFESAYEKVMAASHKQKADKIAIEQHDATTSRGEKAAGAVRTQPPFLIPILMATLSQNTIQAEYYIPESKERFFGRIDPYLLMPWNQRFYLVGRSHKTGDIYTYRLSNFQNVDILDDVFIKVHMDVQREYFDQFNDQSEQDPVFFKVRISPVLTRVIKEDTCFTPLMMTENRNGSLTIEVMVTDVIEFISWLSQYGSEAEILEPVFYREMMKRKLRKWLAVYR